MIFRIVFRQAGNPWPPESVILPAMAFSVDVLTDVQLELSYATGRIISDSNFDIARKKILHSRSLVL
jgi:hypothetical protein